MSEQSNPLPGDPRSFSIPVTVRSVTLIDESRDRPFKLAKVKCDNFEDREGSIFNGIGSFHFYISPQEAPYVGKMLEINVKSWRASDRTSPPPTNYGPDAGETNSKE